MQVAIEKMKLKCSYQLFSTLLILAFVSMLVLQYMISHLQTQLARKSIRNLKMNIADSNTLNHIFHRFIETAAKEKVEYFIFYGTLLGAFRYQGRIPWDDDCDVMISMKDQERVLRRFNQILNPDLAIVETGDRTRSLKMFSPSKSHVLWDKTWRYPFMDIAFYNENETHIWDVFHHDQHRKFLKSDIFPVSHVMYEGNVVGAPNNVQRVLNILYGDYHQCVVPYSGHRNEISWQKDSYKIPCKDL